MAEHEVVYARGYGGQMIWVIADLALTVAVTSDPNRPSGSSGYHDDLHRLVEYTILPEARSRA